MRRRRISKVQKIGLIILVALLSLGLLMPYMQYVIQ